MSDAETVRSIAERVRELTADNERLFRELVGAEKRFRSLSRAAWRVQEDERRRLARELHDGIGQTLTALKNQLETSRQDGRSPGSSPRRSAPHWRWRHRRSTTRASWRGSCARRCLDDLGLTPALRWLARSAGERFSLDVALTLSGLDERLDRETRDAGFRVVQEALTNVAKHAGVRQAAVEVERVRGRVRILVSDPGRGFDRGSLRSRPERRRSGLRGMRDRAELFGGTLRVESSTGTGTRIEMLVPLHDEAAP
jgi:signal transduction histidine kinase